MRADLKAQLDAKIAEVDAKIRKVGRPYALGHAFVWGEVPVKLKNGKVKYVKAIISSVCTDDLQGCLKVCRDNGIQNPFYNLD